MYLVLCFDCDEEYELVWENVMWNEGVEVVYEVYGCV